MSEREEKIRLLSRMNRGRLATPAFLAALSKALGDSVGASRLVRLPESDALSEDFRKGYHDAKAPNAIAYRRFFTPTEKSVPYRLALCLGEHSSNEEVYLFTKLNVDCGAVSASLKTLLTNAQAIVDLDGDSLAVLSKERHQGILLDRNADDCEQAYELTVWGDRWPLVILSCDKP